MGADVLDGSALAADPDDRSEIAVDADRKGDRPNHIRSEAASSISAMC
jgi:hypothetical protein